MTGPKPRYIWRAVFQNFFNSFKRKQTKETLVGEDSLGNKYYESLPTSSSTRTRPSRYYMPHSGEEDFMQEIPAEWESWLRNRRKHPPTPEEIQKGVEIMMLKKENAKKLLAERPPKQLIESQPQSNKVPFPRYGDEFELK